MQPASPAFDVIAGLWKSITRKARQKDWITTEFMTIRLYREASCGGNLGYAAAISCLIFLVDAVVSLLYFRVLRLEEGHA